MRFIMFMYAGVTDEDYKPDPEAFGRMSAYNEEMRQAGVLLALDGLLPSASAAHVTVKDGKTTITDGPFSEAKEVVGGYWIIQAKSREEAVEWASRVPIGEGPRIELRQIGEFSELPQELKDQARMAEFPPGQIVETR
jgi:hypothetical protein